MIYLLMTIINATLIYILARRISKGEMANTILVADLIFEESFYKELEMSREDVIEFRYVFSELLRLEYDILNAASSNQEALEEIEDGCLLHSISSIKNYYMSGRITSLKTVYTLNEDILPGIVNVVSSKCINKGLLRSLISDVSLEKENLIERDVLELRSKTAKLDEIFSHEKGG